MRCQGSTERWCLHEKSELVDEQKPERQLGGVGSRWGRRPASLHGLRASGRPGRAQRLSRPVERGCAGSRMWCTAARAGEQDGEHLPLYPRLPLYWFPSNGTCFFLSTSSTLRSSVLAVISYDYLLLVRHRWAEVVALTARAGVAVDWGALLRTRHVRHFEAMLTSRLYGYEHVDDYYRDNSSCHHFKVRHVVQAQHR